MPLSATATPAAGPTPGRTIISASGGVPPYSLSALPSPPNPTPMPAMNISGTEPWRVDFLDGVPAGTKIYFFVSDANADSAGVYYTST